MTVMGVLYHQVVTAIGGHQIMTVMDVLVHQVKTASGGGHQIMTFPIITGEGSPAMLGHGWQMAEGSHENDVVQWPYGIIRSSGKLLLRSSLVGS
jgi:hypothetical protein